MKEKTVRRFLPWLILIVSLIAAVLLLWPGSPASAHVLRPGAFVIGLIAPQPDSADLNGEGVAWVAVGAVRILPRHDSWVTGTEVLVKGNPNAYAALVDDRNNQYLTFKKLSGKQESLQLEKWVWMQGDKLAAFTILIGYMGEAGEKVPKVQASPRFEETVVYSPGPGHGKYQEVSVATDIFPDSSGNTITLR